MENIIFSMVVRPPAAYPPVVKRYVLYDTIQVPNYQCGGSGGRTLDLEIGVEQIDPLRLNW